MKHTHVPLGHKTRALTPREQDELGRITWALIRALAGPLPEWDGYEPDQIVTPKERARLRASWEALDDKTRDYYANLARNVVYAAFTTIASPPNAAVDAAIAKEASA